jgi:hypothetical protein
MATGNWIKGMVAGFVATVVLSALMLMKAMMGVMPELNPIKMIANMLGVPPAVGWSMHFMIRTVLWGTLFAWLDPTLPGESHRLKGIVFAAGAWLIMMIAMMPMAGRRLLRIPSRDDGTGHDAYAAHRLRLRSRRRLRARATGPDA